jgi:NAD(P)H dehydrogenase (quinone)
MIHFVLEDNTIRGPAGKGKTSPVARNDLSAVAATVLADPFAHENKTYTLTGPEEYDLGQIAAMISEHQNKKVAYIDETMEEAKISRSGSGAEDWLIDGERANYVILRQA